MSKTPNSVNGLPCLQCDRLPHAQQRASTATLAASLRDGDYAPHHHPIGGCMLKMSVVAAFGSFPTYVGLFRYPLPNEATTYLPTSGPIPAFECMTYLPTSGPIPAAGCMTYLPTPPVGNIGCIGFASIELG